MTGTYIQMAAALIFVILLILAAAYVLRKKNSGSGLMSVVSYLSLGPKKGVAALRVGKEVLILGISQNDMRLLKTFDDSELDLPGNEGFKSKLERFRKTGAQVN